MGLELVDAEYKKEGSAYFLRLFVDKRGGVSIEDCEKVSKAVDPIFEKELSVIPDYFEVSSPGLTRPLRTEQDFLRHLGEEVEVALFQPINGSKKMTGKISDVLGKNVTLVTQNGNIDISLGDIASAKRIISFK
jgi:ribosome maturation factor RimP